MQPFFEQQALRFECTRCGRCCIAGDDYHVYLGTDEMARIRDYLGLSTGWFRRRYLQRTDAGDLIAASQDDGRCVFLGEDDRCRVYPVRPVQCRTYPFWPEVVHSSTAWQRESRRCVGIGRGLLVPVAVIRARLDDCIAQPE
jgi:Fe-S-cluster containining protein